MKSALYAAFLGLSIICGPSLAQSAPAAAESREGLPASYTGPASAVAAIVNDKVITTYDVRQRMRLMILSAGPRMTQELLPQVQNRALRDLIEEQLKFSETTKMEVEADPKEIQAELTDIAAGTGLTLPQFEQVLKDAGTSLDTLRLQIRANKVWHRLVQGRFRTRIRVSDKDIEDALTRMREDATNEQFLVSEICIPVSDPSQAQQTYEGSLQLIEQMRRGVPFAVVAQQFSACTSAAGGGDLGWVRGGELPTEIDEAIRALPAQSVTNPIPSEGAFMIMAVRDKREAVAAGEETFTLAYASAPLSMGRNTALLGLEKLATAEPCTGQSFRQDLGPDIGFAFMENVKLTDIDERFHDTVDGLERGRLSGPVEADGALHVVYMCERDEGLGLPSREAIEDRLYGRQFERISQQYLRDVERSALVDVRLKSSAQQPPNG